MGHPDRFGLKTKINFKNKVKSDGQECPFHTAIAACWDSRFLTGLSARFGMTSFFSAILLAAG
jgi:hypothetical protein